MNYRMYFISGNEINATGQQVTYRIKNVKLKYLALTVYRINRTVPVRIHV